MKRPDPLQSLAGIGPSLARDLRALGIRTIRDLRRRNPERMYQRLNQIRGARQDPCVLYVFRCAVYQARTQRPTTQLRKWWNWKDRSLESSL